MKTIAIKQNGKKVYQFIVTDTQLNLAKKLGIAEKDYIIELAKANLANKKEKQ